MLADIYTTSVQRSDFRYLCSEMRGIPVEYDDDIERRQTHPLLLPKLEQVCISHTGSKTLESITVATTLCEQSGFKLIVPENVKVFLGMPSSKKLPQRVLISSRALPIADRRGVLDNIIIQVRDPCGSRVGSDFWFSGNHC